MGRDLKKAANNELNLYNSSFFFVIVSPNWSPTLNDTNDHEYVSLMIPILLYCVESYSQSLNQAMLAIHVLKENQKTLWLGNELRLLSREIQIFSRQ